MKKQDYSNVYIWDKGPFRERNEDAICIRKVRTTKGICALYCVSDGMGGSGQGMEAAKLTITRVEEWFDKQFVKLFMDCNFKLPFYSTYKLIKRVKNSGCQMIFKINEELFLKSRKTGENLGCTITMGVVFHNYMCWFQVGDSALFISKKSQKRVTPKHANARGELTRCLGYNRNGEADFGRLRMNGNLFLICSDGFCNKMTWKEMRNILVRNKKYTKKAQYQKRLDKMLDYQRKCGEKDNISAILFWKE